MRIHDVAVPMVVFLCLTQTACQPQSGGGRRQVTGGPTFRTSLDFGDQVTLSFASNMQTTISTRVDTDPMSTARNVTGEAILDKTNVRITKSVIPGRIAAQAIPDRVDFTFLIAAPDADPCATGLVIGSFAALYNGPNDEDFNIAPGSIVVSSVVRDLIFSGSVSICVRVVANFAGSCEIEALDISFRPQTTGTGGTGSTGTVMGTVVDAQSGSPIPGANVAVIGPGLTAVTDASGQFVISGVPDGQQTVAASAAGFVQTSVPVMVPANDTVEVSIGLVQFTASGDAVQAVLSWGIEPEDIDLHMSGPDGSGGRFHAYFSARQPVPHVCLDLDDTISFGPETMTIARGSTGQFVAGDYHVWIHNFDGTPEFDVSGAVLTLFAAGNQIAQFRVDEAIGNVALDIWRVVEFNVAADGTVSGVRPIQTFTEGGSSSVF